MKKGLVEVVIVLDESGSMEPKRDDAIGAFNTFLEEQKKLEGEANITLATFNTAGEYKVVYDNSPLQYIKNLSRENYTPSGLTALYDAVGTTIDSVGKRLAATPYDERPEKVIFAILTDGMENDSREYGFADVESKIKHQESKYNWMFIYLAAGLDAFAQGLNLGITQTYKFDNTAVGIRNSVAYLGQTISSIRSNDNGTFKVDEDTTAWNKRG